MKNSPLSRSISLLILVAALGYFVDIYDLLLFLIVKNKSLTDLGVPADKLTSIGLELMNWQMAGLLIGGILWGILGDKKGRIYVLFGSILLYSLANIANGLVQDVSWYAALRFIAGIGLAGELGAGITLISETMSKENRGYGTMLVASIGLLGAVAAYFVGATFNWRIAYLVGGGLGMLLLLLRIGVFESGMFANMKNKPVKKGDLSLLFSNGSRIKKYLLVNLDDGEDIGFSIRKKHEESDRFKNTINESVSNDHKENEYSHLVKKVPTIYKALKKGTIELTIHAWDYDTVKPPQYEKQIKFNYELSNLYKINVDDFSNNYPVSILIPEIKIYCPEEPELVKQSIKHRILEKVKIKFNHFNLTLYTKPTQFFLKSNGTWTNL